MLDIIFISYNEPNADANWDNLKSRFTHARRLHGVKGIHRAHQIAAKTSLSDMFWVVDGDSQITDDFKFDDPPGIWKESVYVYRAKNPINNLSYGYGGIKLLPKFKTMNMPLDNVDMTTSISKYFTAVDEVASVTYFNTDEFNAWKSAFRECVKLSSKVINGQVDNETEERLEAWCTLGSDQQYGKDCIAGAQSGRAYGLANASDINALAKINNFKWLEEFRLSQFV
jgi:hypothetical protein